MGLFLERWSPYILALIAAVLWYAFYLSLPRNDAVLGSTMTLGVLFSTFVTTYKALLISARLKVMNNLRSSGYIDDLVLYIKEALIFSILITLISLVGYFIDNRTFPFGLIWVSVLTATIVSFLRLTVIMSSIFKRGIKYEGKS